MTTSQNMRSVDDLSDDEVANIIARCRPYERGLTERAQVCLLALAREVLRRREWDADREELIAQQSRLLAAFHVADERGRAVVAELRALRHATTAKYGESMLEVLEANAGNDDDIICGGYNLGYNAALDAVVRVLDGDQ